MTSSGGRSPSPHRRLWRRWWALLAAGLLLLAMIGAIAGEPEDEAKEQAARAAAPATASGSATATATADPVRAARAQGARLARNGKYAAAIAAYEDAGLDDDADRVRRRGARALYRSARRALDGGRDASARRLALQSRRLRKTAAARTVLTAANTQIAKAKAAERERRRLARIARDARTCTSSEKRSVRDGAGTPAGCATYAADLAAREADKAPNAPGSGGDCDPNYTGACLKPDSPDYDCRGGSGDGPDYTGPVNVVGEDPYDLDRDGDDSACETS